MSYGRFLDVVRYVQVIVLSSGALVPFQSLYHGEDVNGQCGYDVIDQLWIITA